MSDRERNRNGQFVEAEAEIDETAPLWGKLNQLADQIADDALHNDSAEVKLDAFKALSKFWIDNTKLGKKRIDDDGESDGGLPAMRARLKAVGGGE